MNNTYPWDEKPIIKLKVYPTPIWAAIRTLIYITLGVLAFVAACGLADVMVR